MFSNAFRIYIFLFRSYSFGIETINTFIRSCSSLENHTRFQTKWAKCIPVFRPKRRKNPILWGRTHLYGLYKGVPPPEPQEYDNVNSKFHAGIPPLTYLDHFVFSGN